MPDEYDTIYMCRLFEQYKRVMVRGIYAGCGKSYACEEMGKSIKCYLFALLMYWKNYNENGVTLNTFFSVGMQDDDVIVKFDDSVYDVFLFLMKFILQIRRCLQNQEI